MVYKLKLPETWRIHNVFHASLLTPQVVTPEYGIPADPPLPELVDGESEFEVEVESILQHKFVGRKREIRYLVQWRGYSRAESTWEPERHLRNAPEVLEAYKSLQNPFITPRPPPRVLSITPRRVATPVHPLPQYQPPVSPRHPLSPLPSLLSPIREKVVNTQPLPYPPPVLWTPRHPSPPPLPNSLLNSTSALCRCLNVSMSGSHRGGNQGSTSRVYGLWLKSSMPQNP